MKTSTLHAMGVTPMPGIEASNLKSIVSIQALRYPHQLSYIHQIQYKLTFMNIVSIIIVWEICKYFVSKLWYKIVSN